MRRPAVMAGAAVLLLLSAALDAQWLKYPTPGHMDIDITIDDPGAYAKPWTVTLPLLYQADTELLEYICNERSPSPPWPKNGTYRPSSLARQRRELRRYTGKPVVRTSTEEIRHSANMRLPAAPNVVD